MRCKQMNVQTIADIIENNQTIYQMLKHCPYEILRHWHLSEYPSGTIIFHQGDVQESFYIIVDGSVDINIMAENGKKYSQATYHSGYMIGELEIFDQKPFVCNVEALTNVKLIELKREIFFQWLKLDQNFHQYITRSLSSQFYRLSRKAGDDNLYSLYHRVCRYLIDYLEQGVKKRQGTEINVNKHMLSQQFAVTHRSINRILQVLKEKEIIEINSHTLIIRNSTRLKEEEQLSRLD
ncbi:Crp/Fnr family transcriptional regulator [Brevibacillus ginsengisoli]|uniref:Crp/Fnr family transcriptional regulator n=1 Tax=Brevibacillus ginsengisoli TaxID=363854 RepID=UPI003CECD842